MRELTSAQRCLYAWLRRVRPAPLGTALKKLLRIRRIPFRTEDGLRFQIDPVSDLGQFLLSQGSYEPAMCLAFRHLVRPGDVVIDVGANEGYLSMIAAKAAAPEGCLYAIEPQSRLGEVVRTNARLNGLQSVVQIRQVAFSEKNGFADFFLSPDVNTGASGFSRYWRFGGAKENVLTMRLETFFEEEGIQRARLMKVDCEGAETQVFAGAGSILKDGRIDYLLVEYHPHIIGRQACEETDALILGFEYRRTDWRGLVVYTRPGLTEDWTTDGAP
jgi:FkbM family methyltransferase